MPLACIGHGKNTIHFERKKINLNQQFYNIQENSPKSNWNAYECCRYCQQPVILVVPMGHPEGIIYKLNAKGLAKGPDRPKI